MSYRDESAMLARELAHLAMSRASTTLTRRELDVALAARSETLGMLRTVLSDSVGISREATGINQWSSFGAGSRRSVEELEAHPVAMLSRTLATHPALRPQDALSDVLAGRPDSTGDVSPTESWAKVARHALLASHDWSTDRPQLNREQEWSAVADVAALAQVITVLDRHLYTAAQANREVDPGVVEALETSVRSGLRSASIQAAALAAAGPLPDWGKPTPQPPPTRMLLVNSPNDAVHAQSRLAAQIDAAKDINPQTVMLLASGQARILGAAAAAMASTDPQRAARATSLARQLKTSSASPQHQLAALVPDDPRPLAQTREILQQVTRSAGSNSSTNDRAALAAVVDRSPTVIRALATHAEQSLRSGRWLMVDPEARRAKDPLWRQATRDDPEPRLCVSLSAAAAVATTIPVAAPAVPPAVAPPPRQTLSGVLDLDRPTRPQRPAQRPVPDAAL